MVTKSSREMQKDREKVRPPFGGLKFCQGTHYLPLTLECKLNSLKGDMHSLQIKLSNLKRIHIFEKVISNCYFINSQRLIPILLQYLINESIEGFPL